MDKDRLPKRFVRVDGKVIEKKEKPEVIEKLCSIDVGRLLEEFGDDKLGARKYVKRHTGANALMAHDFVRKAYWTLGRGYDEALPQECSDSFWEKFSRVTDDGFRNSPLLRYLEIICPDKELLFASQCTVGSRDLMQIKKYGTSPGPDHLRQEYWGVSKVGYDVKKARSRL